ncbi:MAG: aspartate aminotransferase family protein, partial [Shinella sp.]|nr:aspartate aminotransferase family protein [Shinella sp.]
MTTLRTTRNISITSALEDARARYVEWNPKSHILHKSATDVMPGGNTRSVLFHAPFPLTIRRGQGCRIEDVDGHDYINFLG